MSCPPQLTLHQAASKGNLDAIRKHLADSSVSDVNSRNDRWETPLYCASAAGHVEVVSLLLASGARVDARARKRFTPLHAAARFGHAVVVGVLVKGGADLERGTIREMTPLALAARYGHADCVRCLLELGADVGGSRGDMFNRTPLHWAVKMGHNDIFDLLIQAGADISISDKFGKTVVMQAAKSGQLTSLHKLLALGADATVADRLKREPLHVAAERGHRRCVTSLIEDGRLSINRLTENGKTPLMLAASRCRDDMIHLLLKLGADPDLQDLHDLTAPCCVVTGRLSSNISKTDPGWQRSVVRLIRNGNTDVNILCRWPCSWNEQDSDNPADKMVERNVLELAFRAGFGDIVRPVTIAGADPRRVRRLFSMRTQDLPDYARRDTATLTLDWLRRYFRSPRPLRELARFAVRRAVGSPNFESHLDLLQLPVGIRSYLMFPDLAEASPAEDENGESDETENLGESDTEEEMEPSVFDSDLYGDNEPLD